MKNFHKFSVCVRRHFEIRRESEEVLNSIASPSGFDGLSDMASPPPRSDFRMQVDDLRRKSIELLEALESPKGIENFQMDDEDDSKDIAFDEDSDISDLEEPVKSKVQIVENIQIVTNILSFMLWILLFLCSFSKYELQKRMKRCISVTGAST